MMEDDDAALVQGVRRGSREAAAELARRYLRPARAVALSILHDVAGAEDVSQDAFVYALERIDDCREPARFGAWLMQIVRSRSHNHRRDSKADRTVALEDVDLPSRFPAPDRDAERAQLRERLLAALRELPEDRAAVLLLHDLEGWTHREIAERMEMPAGTIRSHLHHARRGLRERLRELRE
jgi:RNA polymerase sigma-70 factor (ECF subfamily)